MIRRCKHCGKIYVEDPLYDGKCPKCGGKN